jgi:peptidoglycan/LPS O-acetylase OafA/YrhL
MLSTLTSLRFFAIVLIYFHHLDYPFGFGSIGVTFFFVLSGFTMAYNYNRKFICLDAKEVKHFLIKRFSKIYPLHILTFVFSIPIDIRYGFKTNIGYALLNIFLLQSYFPIGIQVYAFNGLSWFISDLMLFYCLTPLLLHILNKFKISQSPKTLLLLSIIVLICEATMANLFPIQPYSFGWWFAYISPYLRIFDYIIGVFIGLFFINIENSKLNKSMGFVFFSMLEVFTALTACAAIYYIRYFPFPSLTMNVYFIPFSVIVIFTFAFQKGILSLILSKKIFIYLGNLSFSFYLIHQLAIFYSAFYFTSSIFGIASEANQFVSQLLLFFVIICLAGIINRYFVEPLRKRVIALSLTRHRNSAPVAQASVQQPKEELETPSF